MALAVGLTPELLPAIVSVTLSAGARRMAKRGVIVRRLEAIENLGSIDILCTDKTGTLTEGVVELTRRRRRRRREPPSACCAPARDLNAALRDRHRQSARRRHRRGRRHGRGSPPAELAKVDEIPYDFIRKRLTIVVAEGDGAETHLIVTKGAFDTVLDVLQRRRGRRRRRRRSTTRDRQRLRDYYRTKGARGISRARRSRRSVSPPSRTTTAATRPA